MLIPLLSVVAGLLVLLLVVVALQPNHFRVSRSAVMTASPVDVFEQVNDLHKWPEWSPWSKLDPAMKHTYQGPSAGVAASYAWTGNSQVGEGRMTIRESRANEWVRIQLEFVRPFACNNNVDFTFAPEGDQTRVTWTMTGPKNFFAKALHLLVSMDKMCGGQFATGLAEMKAIVERAARPIAPSVS